MQASTCRTKGRRSNAGKGETGGGAPVFRKEWMKGPSLSIDPVAGEAFLHLLRKMSTPRRVE